MQVALLTTFVVTKKEPLAVLLERIHSAFLAAGLGEPSILFTFSDAPGARGSFDHRSAAQEVPGLRAPRRRENRDPECSADPSGVESPGLAGCG